MDCSGTKAETQAVLKKSCGLKPGFCNSKPRFCNFEAGNWRFELGNRRTLNVFLPHGSFLGPSLNRMIPIYKADDTPPEVNDRHKIPDDTLQVLDAAQQNSDEGYQISDDGYKVLVDTHQ